jgi:hypothetical protein
MEPPGGLCVNFDDRKSAKNWAKVDYDRDRWIPVPLTFDGTKWPDVTTWALFYARDRARKTYGELTRKLMHKEVEPRAASFMDVHKEMVGKAPAHKLFLNFPDARAVPVPIGIGLWAPHGTREEAFQYYAYWTAHGAVEPPVAEWFETESLGTGVKARWMAMEDGEPTWAVNYIFRNEEFATDVHVFSGCAFEERFTHVLDDLDELVRGIHCTPLP